MSYAQSLRKASWRGVPFGMSVGEARLGRRKVEHDYPYRPTVWLEDQDKLPRNFRITGFLIGNSAVYGGGDVLSQVKRMETAAEAKGQGVLVHPSRGRLTVDLISLVITERQEEGNFFELQFTFVQGGQQLFPSLLADASSLVGKFAGLADAAGLGAFADQVLSPLKQGLDAASTMATTASEWLGKVNSLTSDATSLFGTVSQLGGADFGRYFNGGNAGFLQGLVSPYAGAGSIADLISAGSAQRALVGGAAGVVQRTISSLGVGTGPADVAAAVQATVATLQSSAADPADGLRILSNLAAFTPKSPASGTQVGAATSDLFQRAAATALARVSATYAPSSADDANAVRGQVLAPIEAAITRAGDTGADDVFTSLRGLRKVVTDDLGQRGAALARLTQVRTPQAAPAVVLAQQLYGDAFRGSELVTQADPVHPWFMPTSLTALAY